MAERAAGVILSGGNADGTLGLKAIKEYGGLTFAQIHDGFGPRHPDMPDAAILSGLVDFALPAENLGEKLVQLARDVARGSEGSGDTGRVASTENAIISSLPVIYDILRGQVGHDFSGYKTRTFVRRVQRRMHIVQVPAVDAYLDRLRGDSSPFRRTRDQRARTRLGAWLCHGRGSVFTGHSFPGVSRLRRRGTGRPDIRH
jgi:two-component system CheB/CheR fusion protein